DARVAAERPGSGVGLVVEWRGVPDLHRTVLAGRGQALAARVEKHMADEIGVPAEGEDFLAGRELPEFYRLVEAGGGEVPAVGTEADAGDAHAMGLDGG